VAKCILLCVFSCTGAFPTRRQMPPAVKHSVCLSVNNYLNSFSMAFQLTQIIILPESCPTSPGTFVVKLQWIFSTTRTLGPKSFQPYCNYYLRVSIIKRLKVQLLVSFNSELKHILNNVYVHIMYTSDSLSRYSFRILSALIPNLFLQEHGFFFLPSDFSAKQCNVITCRWSRGLNTNPSVAGNFLYVSE